MIRNTIAIAAIFLLAGGAARAQAPDCRAITDSLERLRCYDAQPAPAVQPAPAAQPAAPLLPPPKPVPPAEDPFVTKAKARVKQQLLDPQSARFQGIKIKTVGGKKGICGMINAKNSAGGMTGTLPFTYDGEYATIMIFNPGPGNPTSMGADILGVTLGGRLEAHDRWCK